MRTINRIQRLLGVAALLMLSGASLHAQTIVNPINPDNPVGNFTIADPYVNADMLSTPSGNLRIVAWQNGNGDTEVKIWDDAGGMSTFIISGAHFPDVALADDLVTPGNYIAVFVYNISNKTFLETYTISGVGSGTITTGSGYQSLVSTGGGFPFIDMFADPFTQVNGLPAMHQFAFTWGVYDPISATYSLNISKADVNNPLAYDTASVVTLSATPPMADVAASADINTGAQTAYLAIQDNVAATLELGEVDYSGVTPVVTTSSPTSDTPYIARIEAMGLHDAASSTEPWTMVSPLWNSTSADFRVHVFNGANPGGFNCTPSGSAVDGNNMCNAVAAGIGSSASGSYNNDNYTIGWHAYANNIFVTQAVDANTGNINTSIPNYYQVNSNPLGIFLPGKLSIALTSNSNSGKALLTVWYDGNNNIFYKETGDVTGYKPTAIAGISKEAAFKLYPNPARNNAYIEMGKGLTFESIRIVNMLGQSVYYNETSASGAVLNLSSFAPGMYQVEVNTKQGKESRKLIIQ